MRREFAKGLAKAVLPTTMQAWLLGQQKTLRIMRVRARPLLRIRPIRRDFGLGHGLAIDRYYIEGFLAQYASDIRGHVLEVGSKKYTDRFGGQQVTQSDVLHVEHGNPRATIVGDLTRADHIPSNTFDCIILTQTMQFIYDVRAAIGTLYRILKPGGVLLATSAGISQLSRHDMDRWGEYWRFTSLSSRKLFSESFPIENVTVQACGNILTSIAFLHGLVLEEMRHEELNHHDPDYEMLITVRAMKPEVSSQIP